jgi:PBSX family phage terminase large subunit|nr:MAG TPA: large terminase [Caudoviricetes sp.]
MAGGLKQAAFRFQPFSRKQKQILTWWLPESGVSDADGIIADGAIRSGKTVCMSLAFVQWSMHSFNGQNFGMCGKTVGSFRRNVLSVLKQMLPARGYTIRDRRTDNLVVISRGSTENYYYIFGGKDEGSQDLVQGITLAGILLDEIALMPESFVNQATGRCSVDGSKFWCNCNPAGPEHWFKKQWIDEQKKRNLLYLHFTMEDNLSLSEQIRARYRAMYTGIFYRRYILGQWCLAEGLVYEFDPEKHVTDDLPEWGEWYISCDYGTLNPFSAGLWCVRDGVAVRVSEFYHSGREKQHQLTDEEYYREIEKLAGDRDIRHVVVDPSAASFITCIRSHGRFSVRKAKNDVMYGIRLTAMMLQAGVIKIGADCKDAIREFGLYHWDDKGEVDKPVKENDHAMDDIRYFCATVMRRNRQARQIIGGICDEETDS